MFKFLLNSSEFLNCLDDVRSVKNADCHPCTFLMAVGGFMANMIIPKFNRSEMACRCGCGHDEMDHNHIEWLTAKLTNPRIYDKHKETTKSLAALFKPCLISDSWAQLCLGPYNILFSHAYIELSCVEGFFYGISAGKLHA